MYRPQVYSVLLYLWRGQGAEEEGGYHSQVCSWGRKGKGVSRGEGVPVRHAGRESEGRGEETCSWEGEGEVRRREWVSLDPFQGYIPSLSSLLDKQTENITFPRTLYGWGNNSIGTQGMSGFLSILKLTMHFTKAGNSNNYTSEYERMFCHY